MAEQSALNNTGDDADYSGTGGAFSAHMLGTEMLESQALRTLVLCIIFASASVVVVIIGVHFYFRYGWSAASTPATVFAMAFGIAVYEYAMLRAIRRHIRLGALLPTWVWYANACVEITVMSATMVFVHGSMSHPVFALSTPPLVGYFFFIILSTLYLDVRLSVFTGCLASIQYLIIVVLTFYQYGSDAAADAIFFTPGMYLAKAIILLFCGLSAALVARELSRRQLVSMRAVEDRNREHHANTMKSQFLADMSHEIRTPLNAVIGYAQLLETDGSITANQRKAVEAIRVGGRHLLSVVNDVLDISKIEAGGEAVVVTRFSLTSLLQEMTLIFAARCAEKRLSWIFDMKSDVGEVAGDEAKLRQVLTNILGNAVKFTQNGSVTLRVLEDGDGVYRFEVEDTGPGIPETQHAEIFDAFAQEIHGRLEGGTGLGLAISQRYVRLMGGEISVISEVGEGALFRFSLPLSMGEAARTAIAESAGPSAYRLAAGQSVRALVTDDIAENRNVLVGMLEAAGVSVETAKSGADALKAIESNPMDIVFLDIRMPGLSGIEVARRLSDAQREDLKLVAVSASVLEHEQAEYRAAGFNGILEKPVQMASLFECISDLLPVSFDVDNPAMRNEIVAVDTLRPVLPVDLHRSLVDAARRHNITDLKQHISAVASLGDAEDAFAAELRDLCGTYDMNAVLAVLKECAHD